MWRGLTIVVSMLHKRLTRCLVPGLWRRVWQSLSKKLRKKMVVDFSLYLQTSQLPFINECIHSDDIMYQKPTKQKACLLKQCNYGVRREQSRRHPPSFNATMGTTAHNAAGS
jgi:hypothetical protein